MEVGGGVLYSPLRAALGDGDQDASPQIVYSDQVLWLCTQL
jgi:hypothetical protein